MGTLCVIDRQPQTLNTTQRDILRSLALAAAQALEGRKAMRALSHTAQTLHKTQALLDRTGQLAGVGGWEVDLPSGRIYWSDETCRIHGVEPGHVPSLEQAIAFYAPQTTELTPRQLDYVSKTEGAAKSLLGLLNDILDFSKVEAGKMTLECEPFRLDRLLCDLSVVLSANVGAKKVEVLFEVDPSLPQVVLGDALRLQQVLINLGGNALKFTTQGQVGLRLRNLGVRHLDQGGDMVVIEFSVRDSGIGIAPEHQAHIFSGFSQAEASTTRRFGGTGLGLAICKRLVELMGGAIRIDSTLGVGSTFAFTLELPVSHTVSAALAAPLLPTHTPHQRNSARQLVGMRILVVEDNLINQQVAEELLSAQGAIVSMAANGKLGVEAVAAAAPQFDVVLMDIQMPVMDGYTATLAIREELGLTKLPIIAMTAHAMSSDRDACLAAGMNEHVGKPFDMVQLVSLLLGVSGFAPLADPSAVHLT